MSLVRLGRKYGFTDAKSGSNSEAFYLELEVHPVRTNILGTVYRGAILDVSKIFMGILGHKGRPGVPHLTFGGIGHIFPFLAVRQ